MRETLPDSFWAHSLAFYAQAGVDGACLKLQERHGLDVNLLLLCLWLGRGGIRLDQRGVARLMAASKPWHDQAVLPLRGVRQRLKRPLGAVPPDAAESLRQRVKVLELEAERLEQDVLAAAAPRSANAPAGLATAAANLAIWSRVGGFAWEAWDQEELALLLAELIPDEAAQAPDLAARLITPQPVASAC
jgi:uncharacterized protein (TIGR02444 family)